MRYILVAILMSACAALAEPAGCRVTFGVNDGPECRCAWKVGQRMPSGSYSTSQVEVCGDMRFFRFETYVHRDGSEKLLSSRTCEYLVLINKMDCVNMMQAGGGTPVRSKSDVSEQRAFIYKSFSDDADYLFGPIEF